MKMSLLLWLFAATLFCSGAQAQIPSPAPHKLRIKPIEVDSSSLASVGYSRRTKTLQIVFLKGGTYQFFDVPRPVFNAIVAANSKGQFFHEHIRDRYEFRRV